MKKILILAGRYLPGFKDGGPVRTLINLTDLLGDEYDIRLAVLDRDHGDTEPYPNIETNTWVTVGKAQVWYYSPGQMNFSLIKKLSKDVDLIYLCGFYDNYGYETLILNRLNKLFGKPVVLASMGSFSTGALSHKSFKKKVFITLCKALGLFKNITWSVTSEYEKKDVLENIGKKTKCIIAEDPPRSLINTSHSCHSNSGEAKIIFLSRICPQKNLLYAAEILQNVNESINFDIYGPLEDPAYWEECEKQLKKLPENVKWHYCGEVETEKVPEIFSLYDGFLFPTMGENYGHVIFESLASGCVPIISDQTPWNDLPSQNAGFVCSLMDKKTFSQTISDFCCLNAEEKSKMGKCTIEVAQQKIRNSKENSGYRKIFE